MAVVCLHRMKSHVYEPKKNSRGHPLKKTVDAGTSQASELHRENVARGGNFGVQMGGMCCAVVGVCAGKDGTELFIWVRRKFIRCGGCVCTCAVRMHLFCTFARHLALPLRKVYFVRSFCLLYLRA